MDSIIIELYKQFQKFPVITTDSRNCPAQSIFFALKGDSFDGNEYAHQALNKGCRLAVVDNITLADSPGMIYVESVLSTLQQLANYHRKQLNIPIIAITGSNGKTTTKELIARVLSEKFSVQFTLGNLNNHIGVPLTLLKMDNTTTIGVVEMGANHPGEIKELCEIAEPQYGLITNIGKAHIEGFGSYEGVRNTKKELYDYIISNKGTVFVNSDDSVLVEMSQQINRLTYGTNNSASVIGENVIVDPYLRFSWRNNVADTSVFTICTQMVGKYNLDNYLAAICIGKHFGIAEDNINAALSDYTPVNNRSQLIKGSSNQILMDAYNANPSSMKVAIENFMAIEHPLKVAILGGMRELGNISEIEHERLIQSIDFKQIKEVYLIGDEFNSISINQQIHHYNSLPELIEHLQEQPIKNSLILVKGSRGNKLETLLPYIQ